MNRLELCKMTVPFIQGCDRTGSFALTEYGNPVSDSTPEQLPQRWIDGSGYSHLYQPTTEMLQELSYGVFNWRDLVAIASHTNVVFGVQADGRVIKAGRWYIHYGVDGNKFDNYWDPELYNWFNVKMICAGNIHVVAMRYDGFVYASGPNFYGECNVVNWQNVVQISTGVSFTAGLLRDGRVVATGKHVNGCIRPQEMNNIVYISAGRSVLVGVTSDGRVVYTGQFHKNSDSAFLHQTVSNWTNIIAVTIDYDDVIMGLKNNGDIVVANGRHPEKSETQQLLGSDAIAIYDSYALLSDGLVYLLTENGAKRVEHSSKLFNSLSSLESNMNQRLQNGAILREKIAKEIQEIATRKKKGLCTYCGGQFKGLFSKKCVVCGKPKNY